MTAAVLIISAFFLYNYLDKTIKSFKQDVIKSLESSIDKIITYESISPSILQYLEIRKFYITDTDGSCLIKAEKMRISFSLYKYFFTDEFPVGSVYFENSSFSYSHERDFSTVGAILSSLRSSPGSKQSLKNLKIQGKNIAISTDIPSGNFKLNNLFLDIDFSPDNIFFNARTGVSGENITVLDNKLNFRTELRLRGNTSPDFSWHNFDAELLNFRTGSFLVKKQNFNISRSENKIKIIKTKARDPFDLYAEYDMDNKIISLNGKSENYRPAKYISLYKKNSPFSGILKSVYSGSILFSYRIGDTSENIFTYSSNLIIRFDKSLVPFKNRVKSVLYGNTEKITITDLIAETEKGNILFKGIYDLKKSLPDGHLTAVNIQAADDFLINTESEISIKDRNNLFIVSEIEADSLKFENVECLLTRHKSRIDYELSYIGSSRGFISAEGSYSTGRNGNLLKSDIKISDLSIKKISSVFINNPEIVNYISENISLNTDLYFETDFKSINLYTDRLSINNNEKGNSISSNLYVSYGNIVFYNILFDWNNYSGEGDISINENAGKYQITSNISLNNELYSFQGDYIKNSSLTLTGSGDLNLALFFERDRTIYYLKTDKLPVPVNSSVPEFSLNIKGDSGSGSYNFFIDNNTVYNLPFLKGENSFINITAGISNSKISLYSFSVKDNFSTVSGNGEINISENSQISGWIKGGSSEREEDHIVMIDYSEGIYDITAELNNFPSERLTDKTLSGDLSGIIRFNGNRNNPHYSLELRMNNGKLLDDPFSFSLSINASSGSMILNNLKLRYNLNRIDSASGIISRDDGIYSFRGNLYLRNGVSDNGSENIVEIDGEIFDNSFKWFSNPLFIENKGIIKVENNQNTKEEFRSWELSYINNESFLIFSGGPANSIEGEITREGDFDISLSNPLPLKGIFKGDIKDGIINSSFKNIELDMKTFGSITNIAYFKADSGKAEGSLSLSGPVNDPDFRGHLSVSGVRASSLFVPAEIILPNTSFIFNGKSLYMPETPVNVEQNRIKVKLDFEIDHWLPREYNVDILTEPGSMLWIKHNFAMVDIDGFASGNIVIEGDEQGLLLKGDIVAKKCIITLSDEEKNNKKKKRSSFDYEIDLKITSGPGVEFYWPSLKFPVLRTYASAGEKLSIYSNTASDEYSLDGNIKIQGGEVFYFSQSFFVKEGSILFNENETKFDPHLTARAELRERTSDNREVKISLIADDTPLSRFSPRFESNPPLSENEIYSLLGESVYTQFGGENISFGSALLSAGSYSSQLIGIFRPFENRMKNILKLDLFTIRTNALQQALGDNSSRNDVTLSDDNLPVNNQYIDNTTIFMGKYFGEYFFLEGLLSFNTRDFDIYQYNDYDVPDFMGMYIKTEVSLEVDTPLFLMDFTVYPQINDFYDSLSDTSLEFSWRFSY